MDIILFYNSLLQTIIMLVTVVVTWTIYKRKHTDIRKDTARRILIEYNKSAELLVDIKSVITEDASSYNIRKLLAIDFYDYNYWEFHNHILYRKFSESEFKNINIYFQKLKNLFDLLETIKRLTEEELKGLFLNATMNKAQNNIECPANLSSCVLLPQDYTVPILELCKEMDVLAKIFPKEKLELLSR